MAPKKLSIRVPATKPKMLNPFDIETNDAKKEEIMIKDFGNKFRSRPC